MRESFGSRTHFNLIPHGSNSLRSLACRLLHIFAAPERLAKKDKQTWEAATAGQLGMSPMRPLFVLASHMDLAEGFLYGVGIVSSATLAIESKQAVWQDLHEIPRGIPAGCGTARRAPFGATGGTASSALILSLTPQVPAFAF